MPIYRYLEVAGGKTSELVLSPAYCGRRAVCVAVPDGASLQPVAATQVTAAAISQRCTVIHSPPRNMDRA